MEKGMSKADINQSIEALRAELDQIASDDPTIKDKLSALIADIEKQVREPDNEGHKQNNLQNLPTLIEQFEADHPKVTTVLGRLLNTLSGMGI
jgi:hypothetical protein